MAILSKSSQITRQLRSTILRGAWKPGDSLPTELELGARFSVGQRTIREAILTLAHEGLVKRRQGAGTFVAERKTATVAIIITMEALGSCSGYHARRTLEEAQRLARSEGFRPVLALGHGATPEEFAASMSILDSEVANGLTGILGLQDLSFIEKRIEDAGIPAVSLVSDTATARHRVVYDYERMAKLGMEWLRERKLLDRAVIFCAEGPKGAMSDRAKTALLERFHRLGLSDVERRMVWTPWSWDLNEAEDVFRRLWQSPERPSVVFFHDDILFDASSRVINSLGIRVPEDLTIITHVNAGREYRLRRPFTGIEFDPAEAVAAAWGYLKRLIEDPSMAPEPQLIAPRLTERGAMPKTGKYSLNHV